MSMRQVNGDVALSGVKTGGTYQSAPLDSGPGVADVVVFTSVSAVSGTSPSLVVSIEQSDDGSSWAAVVGGAAAAQSAVGSGYCNAPITQRFARVTATVSGTTPSFTFRSVALVFAA